MAIFTSQMRRSGSVDTYCANLILYIDSGELFLSKFEIAKPIKHTPSDEQYFFSNVVDVFKRSPVVATQLFRIHSFTD